LDTYEDSAQADDSPAGECGALWSCECNFSDEYAADRTTPKDRRLGTIVDGPSYGRQG